MYRGHIIVSLVLVYILCGSGCKIKQEAPQGSRVSGETMGTTYSIITRDVFVDKRVIDGVLMEYNNAVSTYIPSSVISRFNAAQDTFVLDSTRGLHNMLLQNIFLAKKMHLRTEGSFDPTVMPLVNLWGFGYAKRDHSKIPDSAEVKSVLAYVGFDRIKLLLNNGMLQLVKDNPQCELDLSAIAKGFGVDIIANYLESIGSQDYMVEIGGEVRAKGKSGKNRNWTIGISDPVEGENGLFAAVELIDKSLATSGNYRNFYVVDGQKVSHTINPVSGFPEYNALLSVSIITNQCALADASATACMVMGLDRAKIFIQDKKDLEGYLIYEGEKGELEVWHSNGVPPLNKKLK